MHPKDADKMADSVEKGAVYTVCPDLSVRKPRTITVIADVSRDMTKPTK